MEIVKQFGLDPVLLVAQIVNFLILLFILKKLLYKPVLELLKKREDTIKEGLKQAEESRLLLEETISKEADVLKKANDLAKETLQDAKLLAETAARDIQENARDQAKKIIADAKQQIEEETKAVEKRLAAQVSELSVQILTKSLKELFSKKDEKQIIDRALNQLKLKNNG